MGAYTRRDRAGDRRGPRPGARAVPAAAGAAQAGRRHAVRRRAADARGRPGADEPAEAAAARRAVDGPGADADPADLRHHHGDQPAGHHGAAGRAERPAGAVPGAPGVRAGDRADRQEGHRRRNCCTTRRSRRRTSAWPEPASTRSVTRRSSIVVRRTQTAGARAIRSAGRRRRALLGLSLAACGEQESARAPPGAGPSVSRVGRRGARGQGAGRDQGRRQDRRRHRLVVRAGGVPRHRRQDRVGFDVELFNAVAAEARA